MASSKPSHKDILAAWGKTLPDLIAPGLRVLFCGINPSLYSAAVGHHFARPGNRFWRALHEGGFADRILHPSEQQELLARGYGLTNLAPRATARADELSDEELRLGKKMLADKVRDTCPQMVAVLGISAYRLAFARLKAMPGRQPEGVGGARLWVLPNPSGLNAHYQAADLARVFAELYEALERPT